MDERTLELIEKVLDEPSCYPEFQRKSRDARKAELIDWYEKYGEVNICYNLYGMDRTCAVPNDQYLDRGLFRKQRHDVNARFFPAGSKFPYDYTLLMRDKLSFEFFMQSVFGQRGPFCASIAFLIGGKLYDNTDQGLLPMTVGQLSDKLEGKKVVFKQSFGCSGDDIRIVSFRNGSIFEKGVRFGADAFIKSLSAPNESWLIQDYLCQHEFLKKINASSVNTMRILTFHTGEEVYVGNAVLRYGRNGSVIDNADNGGMMTGIDAEGFLSPYAFSFIEKKRCASSFAGMQLPFFKEAKELVRRAHGFLPGLFTIGWDVVFCPDGPIILEGNDGWDPYLSQVPAGLPLRETWEHYLNMRNAVLK